MVSTTHPKKQHTALQCEKVPLKGAWVHQVIFDGITSHWIDETEEDTSLEGTLQYQVRKLCKLADETVPYFEGNKEDTYAYLVANLHTYLLKP